MSETIVQQSESWLKQHERLIIVTLVLLFGGYIGHGVLNLMAKNADAKVQQAQAQLTQQQTANAQMAAQVQQATQQYQQIVTTLQAQNTQLAQTIAQRNTQLVQTQAIDKTLPVSQLDTKWAADAGVDASQLQAGSNGQTIASQEATVATVQQLDSIPVLKANLSDTQTELTNTKTEFTAANQLIGEKTQQITGLQLQITDEQNTCKAEVADVKAQARKSKLKWFGIGFVTGYIAGHIW